MRTTKSMLSVMTILGAGACAGSQGERVNNAQMEQAEARAETRAEAVDADENAREDSIEQRHDHAQNAAAAEAEAPGAAETMVNVSEERAAYQSQAKARLDKLGIRLDAAQQKISILGSRAPTGLRGDLDTANTQYRALSRDVTGLSSVPPGSWEATTEKLDERMDGLDQRVNDLSERIEEV